MNKVFNESGPFSDSSSFFNSRKTPLVLCPAHTRKVAESKKAILMMSPVVSSFLFSLTTIPCQWMGPCGARTGRRHQCSWQWPSRHDLMFQLTIGRKQVNNHQGQGVSFAKCLSSASTFRCGSYLLGRGPCSSDLVWERIHHMDINQIKREQGASNVLVVVIVVRDSLKLGGSKWRGSWTTDKISTSLFAVANWE